MKIEILKKDLVNLLSKTLNIVEKRNSMPVLMNVLLETEKTGGLKVFATDLELSLTDTVACKVLIEGRTAVSAKSLFEIVRELAEAPITLTKKENNWLEVRQNKYVSKIVGISADEFPVFPSFAENFSVEMDSNTVREMIGKTFYSVSTDETRYHLNGVYFEQKTSGSFSMVATDGHRLSLIVCDLTQSSKILSQQGVIIPRKGLHEIRKIIETADSTVKFIVDGPQLIFKVGSTVLMIRLIEGKYPNYQQFIPQKLSHKAKISREHFLTSLKRVSLLANFKSKAVTLSLSENKMEISSNNPELGDAKEEIEVEYSGKDLKVGFNSKYVTDVLNSIENEFVDFEINDHLSPGVLRPSGNKNYTCVVMPMKI